MLEKSLFILVFILLFMGVIVWSQHVKTTPPDVSYASAVPERTLNNSVQDPYSCSGSHAPLEIEVTPSSIQPPSNDLR